MRAVDATLEGLKRAGIDAVFGIPGGPVIPLFDALHDDPAIRTYLTRHEQGAGHAAQGYAKVTGRAAVCTATSGPGATNLVTPITDAYMDSVPMVALTGQVGSNRVGTDAFQEADIVGITLPVVKHSYLIKEAEELPQALAEAVYIAETGRPGPVLVDVCVDVWAKDVEPWTGGVPEIPGYQPPTSAGHPRQIAAAAKAIAQAKRPVVYAGGGVIISGADDELTRLGHLAELPVTTTLMGLGGFPASDPRWIGMPGMHGIAAATWAFQESDLILAVGVRFDERVLSTVMNEWAPRAKIIHIDVDPAEISKNRSAHIGIAGEAKAALAAIADAYAALPERHDSAERGAWQERIDTWKRDFPYQVDTDTDGQIPPQRVVQALYRLTRGQAIVCTDVGQHQMFAAQHYLFDRPRRWVTSGGLGTMGFGLPVRHGRAGRPPGRVGHRHRRRRVVRDDAAGILDGPDVQPSGEGHHHQQRVPRNGPPVAGAVLGGPICRDELRGVPAELRGDREGIRDAGGDGHRRGGSGGCARRDPRARRACADRRARRFDGEGVPDGPAGQGPGRDDRGRPRVTGRRGLRGA